GQGVAFQSGVKPRRRSRQSSLGAESGGRRGVRTDQHRTDEISFFGRPKSISRTLTYPASQAHDTRPKPGLTRQPLERFRLLVVDASATPSSRQDDAEAVAELGQVRPVDGPVAVEVERRHVKGTVERVAEGGQVQAVDRFVAVHVAEQA